MLLALSHHDMYISIENVDLSLFDSIKLKCNYHFYNPEAKQNLNLYSHNFHHIACEHVYVSDYTKLDINLSNCVDGHVRGFFIQGDISKLTGLKLIICGIERFKEYDDIDIKMLCHKISDNMLYFSYTGENDYDKTWGTSGCFNHSENFKDVHIMLKFSENL